MKTIIAGSRDIDIPLAALNDAVIMSGFDITEVVSGTARGIDRTGELWAEWKGVPVARFPANWEKNGKAAGYLRNDAMARYADALVAVWDGKSKGTKHMIDLARKREIEVYVHNASKG
jgi:hypothetical protein